MLYTWNMITGLVITLIVLLSLLALSRLFPGKYVQTNRSTETVSKQKFNKLMSFSLLLLVFLVPVFTYFLYKICEFIQQLFLISIAYKAIYTVGAVGYIFFAPALFLSLVLAGVVINIFVNLVGKIVVPDRKEWKFYMDNFNLTSARGMNMDNTKVFIIMTIFIVPISLIWIVLAIRNYAQFTERDIYYQRFMSLKGKYLLYNELNSIKLVNSKSNGDYYDMKFNDGSEISTLNLNINKTPKEAEIVKFVSYITNIPIEN